MSKDMNGVFLIGRVTRDAELKHTNGGDATIKFSIAVNSVKKKGDNYEDYPNYFDCQMFGKRAEGVHKFLTKGKQIGVTGELRQDRWEQDGQNRSKVYVQALDIELLRDVGDQRGSSAPAQQHNAPTAQQTANTYQQQDDDDTPF